MGCGCGGSTKPAGATSAVKSGSNNGPSNPQGAYYWTGPKQQPARAKSDARQ